MKKLSVLAFIAMILHAVNVNAVDNNTVEIVYNGDNATVTIAPNISNYVTVQSGSSSHVKLIQNEAFEGVDATINNVYGEIIYVLSGTSTDGEFYVEGSYKSIVELNGLSLTNPSGPAINIQNGKRISFSVKKDTKNSISDGVNEEYNGCLHCKGHLKMKGKGELNVSGNSRHGIYSKEYIEIKNLTLNITNAIKDAIHCKEYFLMESGTVNISSAQDDGIQVELSGLESTGVKTDHEDEDTGNFYMESGTLTITGYAGSAIKTDGTISYIGGTQNFDVNDTQTLASINDVKTAFKKNAVVYDLSGRRVMPGTITNRGVYVVKRDGMFSKIIGNSIIKK